MYKDSVEVDLYNMFMLLSMIPLLPLFVTLLIGYLIVFPVVWIVFYFIVVKWQSRLEQLDLKREQEEYDRELKLYGNDLIEVKKLNEGC